MKIRNGFVSNSSTSSFLIAGIKIDNVHDFLIQNNFAKDKEEAEEILEEVICYDNHELLNLKFAKIVKIFDVEDYYLGVKYVGHEEDGAIIDLDLVNNAINEARMILKTSKKAECFIGVEAS